LRRSIEVDFAARGYQPGRKYGPTTVQRRQFYGVEMAQATQPPSNRNAQRGRALGRHARIVPSDAQIMEFSMRNQISYTVLGLALAAGVSTANAQPVTTREIADRPVETVITQQPGSMLVAQEPVVSVPGAVVTQPVAAAPVETVETVRTVHSTTISPRHRIVSRHVIRSRAANRVTTTRTTVTERVVPAPVMVAPPAVEAVAPPTYTGVV
jgi:hypothetical protein